MKKLLMFMVLGMGGLMAKESLQRTAVFAGGCFWCMESPFEKLDGVMDVVSGYTGGTGTSPNYKNYASTGDIEAIQVTYDSNKISYDDLLNTYWQQIDPTDAGGSFGDRGPQYRSVIFYSTPEEQKLALASKKLLGESGRFTKPIVTEVLKASTFYPAEEYHQDYAQKHP